MAKNGTNGNGPKRKSKTTSSAHDRSRREMRTNGARRHPPRRWTGPLDPSALLPLTEPMFHILLALANEELHGYGIIISVEEATNGEVRLRTGTLYTALQRMMQDGLIEESDRRTAQAKDGRRRYYRLTRFGWAVARLEARRVADLAALAKERLGGARRNR